MTEPFDARQTARLDVLNNPLMAKAIGVRCQFEIEARNALRWRTP